MPQTRVLAVFPSKPEHMGDTIQAAIEQAESNHFHIDPWPNLDIPGYFIAETILTEIDSCDFLLADITQLNFNVLFEIGYAIGKQRRVVPILDKSFNPQEKEITSLGILDTIGYTPYQNSQELAKLLVSIQDFKPLCFRDISIDQGAPIYVIDTLYKTDASVRILSKIKKSRIRFRSFDPQEQSRLSAMEAYQNVAQSVAIIVHLLSSNQTDWLFNNYRGAFIAGLCYGLARDVLIFQEGDDPVPINYRDFVCSYKHPDEVDKYLNPLGPKVVEALQSISTIPLAPAAGFMEKLDLGSPAAENEVLNLQYYYMKTDEFNKVLQTGARLAIGRKGSGKTALFFQARDKLRQNKQVFVLDLKPEGHQLKRFKYLVLNLLSEAVKEHAATAFWEYVLYLELCYKVLDKDREVHVRNHELYEPYKKLEKLYRNDIFIEESDFSERMLKLINRISERFQEKFGNAEEQYLDAGQVTAFIYQHDVPELRKQVTEYLKNKERVVILFDNLDKGWPTRGIETADILLLRGLLDATRKIEHEFQRQEMDIHTTVFLRDDVYELLVEQTPDRGKESCVSLDWSDSDLLREFIRRRIVYNDLDPNTDFNQAWNQICVSHVVGEDSAAFLIGRCLMRPRNFLNLVNHCKSIAVNLRHPKIQEEDIAKALDTYSADISGQIGFEIRDVFPQAEDVLYYFIGAPARLSLSQIKQYIGESNIPPNVFDKLVEILLWFAFLGVIRHNQDEPECYIYNVQYDIRKLKRFANDLRDDNTELCIHKGFWPFLGIQYRDP